MCLLNGKQTCNCGTEEHSSPLLSPERLVIVVPLKGFSLPHKTTTQLIPIKLCSKENKLLRNGDRAAPLHGLGGEAEKVSWPSSYPCARSYWWSFQEKDSVRGLILQSTGSAQVERACQGCSASHRADSKWQHENRMTPRSERCREGKSLCAADVSSPRCSYLTLGIATSFL